MITTITEREQALQRELDRAIAAGHAMVEMGGKLILERDKLAGELKALRDSDVALPDHDHYLSCDNGRIKVNVYFKDTLTRYGDRRAMAERERCAGYAERLAKDFGSARMKEEWGVATDIAEAIRKGE